MSKYKINTQVSKLMKQPIHALMYFLLAHSVPHLWYYYVIRLNCVISIAILQNLILCDNFMMILKLRFLSLAPMLIKS